MARISLNNRGARISAICVALALLGGCSQRAPVLPRYVPPSAPAPESSRTAENFPERTAAPAPTPRKEAPAEGDDLLADVDALLATLPAHAQRDPSSTRPANAQPTSSRKNLDTSAGLSLRGRRLPKADISALGTTRAIAFPIVLGGQRPTWTPAQIAESVFGPESFRAAVEKASSGAARMEVDVFPTLVDPESTEDDYTRTRAGARNLVKLARRSLIEWAERANLAAYDNDGVDEKPYSGDDDGVIDHVYLVIEMSKRPAAISVPVNLDLPAGRDGRLLLRVKNVTIIPVPPRTGEYTRTLREYDSHFWMHTLSGLGIVPEDVFFAGEHQTLISTGAKVRLGWQTYAIVNQDGAYQVSPRHAVLMGPLKGFSGTRYWLAEQRGSSLYVSQVISKDGSFRTVLTDRYDEPGKEIILPLTRKGASDRAATIRWTSLEGPIFIDVGRIQ